MTLNKNTFLTEEQIDELAEEVIPAELFDDDITELEHKFDINVLREYVFQIDKTLKDIHAFKRDVEVHYYDDKIYTYELKLKGINIDEIYDNALKAIFERKGWIVYDVVPLDRVWSGESVETNVYIFPRDLGIKRKLEFGNQGYEAM